MEATVVLDRRGRVVIPAEVRAALGLTAGEELHLYVSGPRIALERPADAIAELRQLGAGESLTLDELLGERRVDSE